MARTAEAVPDTGPYPGEDERCARKGEEPERAAQCFRERLCQQVGEQTQALILAIIGQRRIGCVGRVYGVQVREGVLSIAGQLEAIRLDVSAMPTERHGVTHHRSLREDLPKVLPTDDRGILWIVSDVLARYVRGMDHSPAGVVAFTRLAR